MQLRPAPHVRGAVVKCAHLVLGPILDRLRTAAVEVERAPAKMAFVKMAPQERAVMPPVHHRQCCRLWAPVDHRLQQRGEAMQSPDLDQRPLRGVEIREVWLQSRICQHRKLLWRWRTLLSLLVLALVMDGGVPDDKVEEKLEAEILLSALRHQEEAAPSMQRRRHYLVGRQRSLQRERAATASRSCQG